MDEQLQKALDGLQERVDAKLNEINTAAEEGKVAKGQIADLDSMLKDQKDATGELKQRILDLEQRGANLDSDEGELKSVGTQFVESESFKNYQSGQSTKARAEFKATLINNGNDLSRHDQIDAVQGVALRQLNILPSLMQGTADSNIIYFPRETAFTNNADGQGAEGTTKAESAVTIAEVNEPIITIAHFLPVSKQALEDSTWLQSYLDTRMSHGVMNKLDAHIVSGLSASNQISGWVDGNSTATNPAGTGNIFGLANKMKTEIESADYVPDYFYMNPIDFAAMETIQRGTGDAAYVAASGAINYVNNGMTLLLWGVPVIKSNNIPQGTIYCKSRMADQFVSRSDVALEMFEQDSDNVQKNLVTVRAEMRGALLTFAPTAIRSGLISGIT